MQPQGPEPNRLRKCTTAMLSALSPILSLLTSLLYSPPNSKPPDESLLTLSRNINHRNGFSAFQMLSAVRGLILNIKQHQQQQKRLCDGVQL